MYRYKIQKYISIKHVSESIKYLYLLILGKNNDGEINEY